ncbi:hypothetical protein HanXRQr2_Chr13g0618531 [Helianthus annuus]|uniref:Uncharacterized protein n=1 Tax=Helianthus annuus TaxID=4232 RepID=A0A9K3ELI3_HELAN|nr:hypothetical protein HanXRQr2_Chr13g0618531 [Helianthus annuus]
MMMGAVTHRTGWPGLVTKTLVFRYVFFDSSNDFYWKLFEARSYCSQVTTIRNATSFTRFIVTKNINKTALQRFDSYIHGNCVEDGP